jgi:predicted component of type VI protein secretion system
VRRPVRAEKRVMQFNLRRISMKRLILAAALSTVAGCASNKASDEPDTRIRDSTTTAKDTVNPSDTATHVRDTVPDSTSR